MADPKPLPVWDKNAGELVEEFLDDDPTTYESQPQLAPVDCHRVHYVDNGTTGECDRLGNRNWTVNQNALRLKPDILFRNERSIQFCTLRISADWLSSKSAR